jgi:hypothetical protein
MPTLIRDVQRVRSVFRRPLSDLWMILKIFLATLIVRTAIDLLPFRRVLRYTGQRSGGLVGVPPDQVEKQKRLIVWAADALARRMLPDRPCLTQAIVVKYFFGRRAFPAVLRIGVTRVGQKLLAHAWIESEGEIVIGGASSPDTYLSFPPIQH